MLRDFCSDDLGSFEELLIICFDISMLERCYLTGVIC
jgi:hypothetical protein